MRYIILIFAVLHHIPSIGQNSKLKMSLNPVIGYTIKEFQEASPIIIGLGITTNIEVIKNKYLETGFYFLSYSDHANDRLWKKCYSCYFPDHMESHYNSIDIAINLLIPLDKQKTYYLYTGINTHLFIREKVKFLSPSPNENQIDAPKLNTWGSWSFLRSKMRVVSPEMYLNIGIGRNFSIGKRVILNNTFLARYNASQNNNFSIMLKIGISPIQQENN